MTETSRVDSEPGYILHSRAYRETSRILEAFTQEYGRVALVARGAMRPKSQLRSAIQVFQPLHLSWSGRGELYTLRHAEISALMNQLAEPQLMAAYYMNELIIKLLHRGDPHPELFAYYSTALSGLSAAMGVEQVLRQFEMALLGEVGYGLNLASDSIDHAALQPDQRYEYRIEHGAVPVENDCTGDMVFDGAELLAIGRAQFDDAEVLGKAKRLLRNVIQHHLHGKQLQTRAVFAAMKRQGAA